MRLLSIILFVASVQAQTVAVKHRTVTALAAAATPSFSPASGEVSNPTTVTISTASSACSSYIYWGTSNPPTTGDTNGTSISVTSAQTYYAKVIGCPTASDSASGTASYTLPGPATLVSHCNSLGAGVSCAGGIDTTTSTSLWVFVWRGSTAPSAPTDAVGSCASPCNTWTQLPTYGTTGSPQGAWYYASPASGKVGGGHTITCTGSACSVLALKGPTTYDSGTNVGAKFYTPNVTSSALASQTPSAVGGVMVVAVAELAASDASMAATTDHNANFAGGAGLTLAEKISAGGATAGIWWGEYSSTTPVSVTATISSTYQAIAVAAVAKR